MPFRCYPCPRTPVTHVPRTNSHRVWLLRTISGERREMTAFVGRFERPTEPERDEYQRHSTLCESFSPQGHSLVRLRNCFG
jgi:hypothetical protein